MLSLFFTAFVLGLIFNAAPGAVMVQTVRESVAGGFRPALAALPLGAAFFLEAGRPDQVAADPRRTVDLCQRHAFFGLKRAHTRQPRPFEMLRAVDKRPIDEVATDRAGGRPERGADLEDLVRRAGLLALREDMDVEIVQMRHFEEALEDTRASVTPDMEREYEELADSLKRENPLGRQIGFQAAVEAASSSTAPVTTSARRPTRAGGTVSEERVLARTASCQ